MVVSKIHIYRSTINANITKSSTIFWKSINLPLAYEPSLIITPPFVEGEPLVPFGVLIERKTSRG